MWIVNRYICESVPYTLSEHLYPQQYFVITMDFRMVVLYISCIIFILQINHNQVVTVWLIEFQSVFNKTCSIIPVYCWYYWTIQLWFTPLCVQKQVIAVTHLWFIINQCLYTDLSGLNISNIPLTATTTDVAPSALLRSLFFFFSLAYSPDPFNFFLFFCQSTRVWQNAEVVRITLLYRQNFGRVKDRDHLCKLSKAISYLHLSNQYVYSLCNNNNTYSSVQLPISSTYWTVITLIRWQTNIHKPISICLYANKTTHLYLCTAIKWLISNSFLLRQTDR